MIVREFLATLGLEIDKKAWAEGDQALLTVQSGMNRLVEIGRQVIHVIAENGRETLRYANTVANTAQSVGVSTDALQELGYAAEIDELQFEDLAHGLTIMTRIMREAKGGSEEAAKGFHKLGVKITDGNGKLRDADLVLRDVAEAVSKMPDGAEKTAAVLQVLGKSGARFIPLLNEGAAGFDRLRAEAHDAGLVISKEFIAAAAELDDNLDRLKLASQGLWRQGLAPLFPAINRLILRLLAWRKEGNAVIVSKLEKWFGYLDKAIEVVGVSIEVVRNNLKALEEGLGALGGALRVFGIIAAIALSPVLVPFLAFAGFLAGVMLLIDDIQRYKQGRDSLFGDWKKTIDEWLVPNENDPWWLRAIKDFVRLMERALGLSHEVDSDFGATHENDPWWLKAIKEFVGWMEKAISLLGSFEDRMARAAGFIAKATGAVLATKSSGAAQSIADRGSSGIPEVAFSSASNMSMPAIVTPGNGAMSYAVQAPVQINVTTQPGQSNEAIASMIEDKISDHWDQRMSEAGAHGESQER